MPKKTTPDLSEETIPGLDTFDLDPQERDAKFLEALAREASDGNGDTTQDPDAGSSDKDAERLALSEEIQKLRRENEILREQTRSSKPAEEPEEPWEPEEWEIPDKPGFEELMPDYRTRMNYLYREVQALKRENAHLSQLMVTDRSQDHLSRFKRDVKDWKQFEPAMLEHADKMGGFPSDYDGLVELYETVRDRAELQRLRQDQKAAKRAGPSPRMGTARTATRQRLETSPANGKPMSIQEAVRQAARRMQQTPGML